MKSLYLMALLSLSLSFSVQAKEYDRNQLPQLSQKILENSSLTFTATTIPLVEIKPVQSQRVPDLKKQEKRLIKAKKDTYRPLVVDQDGYLIDGHHRYDALTELGVENVRVFVVAESIETVVDTFTEYRDFRPAQNPIEEVMVVGTRSTLMSAIDKQAMSDKLISVIDSDALGAFADSTAADAVRRVSGISVENDQGEGRYITIRGLSSDLNSVGVNGVSLVAPENGRSVIMDGVPTELLDSIEVSKSLLPEMDADAIGGRIEFNTKKPTDLKDRILTLKVKGKSGDKGQDIMPNGSILYGDYITENTAHIIGLTYSSRQILSHNNETGFGWEDGYMNDDYEMRWYDVERERYGLSYDISHTTDTTVYFANVLYNKYDEAETRHKHEYGKIKATDTVIENGIETSRVRHDAETKRRYETRSLGAVNLGFETMAESYILDGQVSYSFAEEDDSDNADITFRNYDKDFGGSFEWSQPRLPTFTAYDENLRNPENLEFDAFETWANISRDDEMAASMNIEFETDYGTIKTGFKYRDRTKEVDDYIIAYELDAVLADFDFYTPDWIWNHQQLGPHMTGDATYALRDIVDTMEVDFSDDLSRDFTTDETIKAIYVQNTQYFENGSIVYGVRYEDTTMNSFAYDQDGEKTFGSNSYSFVSPNLTVKYYLTDELMVRGALWRGLSRPGFKQSSPKTSIDVDSSGDISGEVGNPLLQPYKSNNFDLSLEYYGEGMTFASIGYFRKNISDAIYPTFQRIGTYNGIDFNDGVETWINSPDSTVDGIEVNLQYGLENGLYIATNVTLTDSESSFLFEDGKSFTTPFRKLADKAANVSLGFENDVFDIRLAGSYRGKYLDWLADEDGDITEVSENNMRFVSPHLQWDLTAKAKLNDNVTLRFEVVNLNDREEYYYWGNERQLSQFDNYGTSYVVGFDVRM